MNYNNLNPKHSFQGLGLSLYERSFDKKKCYIKYKFFSGLIYSKYDMFHDTINIKILGLTIFRSKLVNSYKLFYLTFLPVWICNTSGKFLCNLLDKTLEQNPDYDDYYVFLSRSGEFFLLMHHFKEWLHKNKSSNFVLVFSAKYHVNICKMFFPDIPAIYMKQVNVPIVSHGVKNTKFQYKGKNIYVPTYEKYFVDVENSIRDNGSHYYEMLKSHLGLSDNTDCYQISSGVKEKVSKIVRYILKDNFVLISPETLSNVPMDKDFWDKLCWQLQNAGFEIFCNAMEFRNLVSGTQSVFLTYEESIELSKYAKAIIGMRSGYLECLSQNNVPLFALYTDFPKRPGFKRLKSDKVLSGYSISKLPNVNKELLFEYDVNKYDNDEDIISEIMSKIQELNLTKAGGIYGKSR